MDVDDLVVPTSDQEELEELAATTSDYWVVNSRNLSRRRDKIALGDLKDPSGTSAKPRRLSLSPQQGWKDATRRGTPPRKRRKIDVPSSPVAPLLSRTNLLDTLSSPRSSPTSYIPDQDFGAPTSSPTSYAVPSPSRLSPVRARSPTGAIGSDFDFFAPQSPGPVASPLRPNNVQKASTGSPSLSPDPLLLFTPPRRARTPNEHFASPLSSPLTPASSPPKPPPGPSTSPRSPPPFTPESIPAAPALAPPSAAEQAQEEEAWGRYSLRARNPRQLNPYEYDKRLYKRQMQANPDAIVKVVSPPRHPRRQRSTSARPLDDPSQGDDEYYAGEDDLDDEEARAARRRRKGKERAIDDDGGDMQESKWVPDVFTQSSSSDEGSDVFANIKASTVAAKKKADKEQRRKKRRERFPMKGQDLKLTSPERVQPQQSPPPERETDLPPPRPRPRPRIRTEVPAIANDADSVDPPPSSSRRRRSVTIVSPARSSHSPPAAEPDEPFNGIWENNHHLFQDPSARGQSPFDVGFDSPHMNLDLDLDMDMDMDDAGASSEVPDPPRTPSEPNDVIDLTSNSGQSSPDEMDERDRKRMKALQRMVPEVMIRQLEKRAQQKKDAAARASLSMDRDEEEVPLRPGETRKRVRAVSSRSIEVIRGDSESSDVDMGPSPGPAGVLEGASDLESSDEPGLSSSDEESVIAPIGHQPRRKHRLSTGDGAAHKDPGDDDSSSSAEGDEGSRGLSNAPRQREDLSRFGEAVVDNNIDRMLTRNTFHDHGPKRKKRSRRKDTLEGGGRRLGGGGAGNRVGSGGGGGGGGRSGSGDAGHGGIRGGGGERLRITTSGAKRYGTGQQTLLNFKRVSPERSDAEIDVAEQLPLNEVHFTGDEPGYVKQKIVKPKPKSAGVYVFGPTETHLGGRANPRYVTIDEEVEVPRGPGVHDADAVRPSKLNRRLQKKPSKKLQSTTLETFWDEQYEDDGFVVPEQHNAPKTSQNERRSLEVIQQVTEDFGIEPLPAGITFPNTTYLGRGWLYDLVGSLPGTHPIPAPPSLTMFDCYLHLDISVPNFTACLESISDKVRNLIFGNEPAQYETCQKWRVFLHSVSQHLSWLLSRAQEGEVAALTSDSDALVRRLASLAEEPTEILPDDETPNPLVLQVLWFVVELTVRIAVDVKRRTEEPDKDAVTGALKGLITKLWDFTFAIGATPLELNREALTQPSVAQQIAELWIAVLNLTHDDTFQKTLLPPNVTFWTIYLEVVQVKALSTHHTDLKAQEAVWKSVFTLCALSQFSVHGNSSMTPRIQPSWSTIIAILNRAPLSPDTRKEVSKRVVRIRDRYIRVLVCRCLWLNLKWHWRLDADDAKLLFSLLNNNVFRCRSYASLADEQSDFPGFLRHYDVALLLERNRSDIAHTLFLKMAVRAGEDHKKHSPPGAQATHSPIVKQILSLLTPIARVPFSKDNPPTLHQLSMLYNRFSAVAVAIYLEPTEASVKHRISIARRYVDFAAANKDTRLACIRGVLHLAIVLQDLALPLRHLLEWLADMANILVDEYQASDASKVPVHEPHVQPEVVTTIELLLGCVRRILSNPSEVSKRANRDDPRYPDPGLLQGPWVTRVFSTATNLSARGSTGHQIRSLMDEFLRARSLVVSTPRRPPPRVVTEDSQDSQDLYGGFDLDFDDPELLAALGDDVGSSRFREIQEKEALVSQIIHDHVERNIYRLVCKHCIYQEAVVPSITDADKWIDCWVACCDVVVKNNKKDWTFFLNYAPHSWQRIIDPVWQRRVGLRFMHKVLLLDPPAYTTLTDHFINVLFTSFATASVTIEHEYASLLFSIDRLHHPLLLQLPIDPPGPDGDYHLSKREFIQKRPAILDTAFKSLSNSLNEEASNTAKDKTESQRKNFESLVARNQTHVSSVVELLCAMEIILQGFAPNSQARTSYLAFYKEVLDILARYPLLINHTRLTSLVARLRSIS